MNNNNNSNLPRPFSLGSNEVDYYAFFTIDVLHYTKKRSPIRSTESIPLLGGQQQQRDNNKLENRNQRIAATTGVLPLSNSCCISNKNMQQLISQGGGAPPTYVTSIWKYRYSPLFSCRRFVMRQAITIEHEPRDFRHLYHHRRHQRPAL
mmetsp:Transcript_15100/g.34806  ORF Transcript_15100/g.34806 Transcript_15100/m.34806 type:complete len:150 (+) Transcript_15100:183-632(+)